MKINFLPYKENFYQNQQLSLFVKIRIINFQKKLCLYQQVSFDKP